MIILKSRTIIAVLILALTSSTGGLKSVYAARAKFPNCPSIFFDSKLGAFSQIDPRLDSSFVVSRENGLCGLACLLNGIKKIRSDQNLAQKNPLDEISFLANDFVPNKFPELRVEKKRFSGLDIQELKKIYTDYLRDQGMVADVRVRGYSLNKKMNLQFLSQFLERGEIVILTYSEIATGEGHALLLAGFDRNEPHHLFVRDPEYRSLQKVWLEPYEGSYQIKYSQRDMDGKVLDGSIQIIPREFF